MTMSSRKRETLFIRRRQKLLPQIVVAEDCGISQAQYSMIESGYIKPTKPVADKLIDMFELPSDYFDEQGEEVM